MHNYWNNPWVSNWKNASEVKRTLRKILPEITQHAIHNLLPLPDLSKRVIGCGNVGCAFSTYDNNILVKLTRCDGELESLIKIYNYQLPGFLPSISYVVASDGTIVIWKRKLHLVNRKAISYIAQRAGISAIHLLEQISKAINIYSEQELDADIDGIFGDIPGMQSIARGLVILQSKGWLVEDLCVTNLGVLNNELVVYDAQIDAPPTTHDEDDEDDEDVRYYAEGW